MHRMMRRTIADYDFHAQAQALNAFCALDLSAFYFDVRKDVLYCDDPAGPRRRAARTVMDLVFNCLTAWLAPVLCFTAEEAWWTRHGEEGGSVHERLFPEVPEAWLSPELAAKWERVRRVRRVITGALEVERAEKRIGGSLQAHPVVHVPQETARVLETVDFDDICITSGITVLTTPAPDGAFTLEDVPEVAVAPALAEGQKCQRCWKILAEVPMGGICRRCFAAVEAWRQAAE